MTVHVRTSLVATVLVLAAGLLGTPAHAGPTDPLQSLVAQLDAAKQAEEALAQVAVTWQDTGKRSVAGTPMWYSTGIAGSYWRNRGGEWAQQVEREYESAIAPRDTRVSADGYVCVQRCASRNPSLQAWVRTVHNGRSVQGTLPQDPSTPGPSPYWGDPPILPAGAARALIEAILLAGGEAATTITETGADSGRTRTLVESTTPLLNIRVELTWESSQVTRMAYRIKDKGTFDGGDATGFYQTVSYSDRAPVIQHPERMPSFSAVMENRLREQARNLAKNTAHELARKARQGKRPISSAWVDRHLDSAAARAAAALGNPGFETLAGVHPLSRAGAPLLLVSALPDPFYWPSVAAAAPPAYSAEILISQNGKLTVGRLAPDQTFVPEETPDQILDPAPEPLISRILGATR